MVAHSRAAVRADRLRPLNAPRPIRVDADARGFPVVVYLQHAGGLAPEGGLLDGGAGAKPPNNSSLLPSKGRARPEPLERGLGGGVSVLQVMDRWRIDDEWWRKEISRMYFRVVLANGAVITIFHDLVEDGWFLQTVATPMEQPEPVAVVVPGAVAPAETAAKLPLRRIGVG